MGESKLLVCFLRFCTILLFCEELLADRTSRKIYEEIQGNIFCFRRLNATNQIGCSSDHGGNIGVVHVVNTTDDILWITESGPNPPYIAAISIDFFNVATMTKLRDSGRVTGVLILHQEGSPPPHSFSPDQSCPNRNFGLYTEDKNAKYAACKYQLWNPNNTALGMMYEDWNMPVFLITNESSISSITDKCYNRFNNLQNTTSRKWLLCAAQLKSTMLAAKDSSTCMRRSKISTSLNRLKLCDPLRDRNVVTTLFPTNKSEEVANRSVIVVGVRLDAYSLFDRLAPGAHTSVTGLVTLLTVANTLSKLNDLKQMSESASKRNVLFVIFNGEAFDYIGSSRVVYDMEKGVFPVKITDIISQPAPLSLHHISHFIELSQLAPSDDDYYWIHMDPVSLQNDYVREVVANLSDILLKESENIINIKTLKEDPLPPLPPASLQSFLRRDNNIPGIVITDHEKLFTNRYYNSMFDTAETLTTSDDNLPTNLTNLATAISRTIYKLLTDQDNTSIIANETLVKELLECYLRNAACNLFREIADPNKTERLRTDPYPLYVSVESENSHVNAITQFTRYLLAYLTGEEVENRTRESCINDHDDQIYIYDWMTGPDINSTGICYRSTVMFTVALSPAHDLDDWESTEYSTWTESVWRETSVRIFLQPDKIQEGVTLAIGIFILIVSLITVYFANKRASILFGVRSLVGC